MNFKNSNANAQLFIEVIVYRRRWYIRIINVYRLSKVEQKVSIYQFSNNLSRNSFSAYDFWNKPQRHFHKSYWDLVCHNAQTLPIFKADENSV